MTEYKYYVKVDPDKKISESNFIYRTSPHTEHLRMRDRYGNDNIPSRITKSEILAYGEKVYHEISVWSANMICREIWPRQASELKFPYDLKFTDDIKQ